MPFESSKCTHFMYIRCCCCWEILIICRFLSVFRLLRNFPFSFILLLTAELRRYILSQQQQKNKKLEKTVICYCPLFLMVFHSNQNQKIKKIKWRLFHFRPNHLFHFFTFILGANESNLTIHTKHFTKCTSKNSPKKQV